MSYIATPLIGTHEKATFKCENEMLTRYIQTQARQDVKAKVSACFILSDDDKVIKGYYTLANGSIPRSQLPDAIIAKLPRYKDLPITLLGRLARDLKYKGKGIGELLLLDALKRSFDISESSIASMAVVVDPIDQRATDFYSNFGFMILPDSGRMFLSMETIGMLFKLK